MDSNEAKRRVIEKWPDARCANFAWCSGQVHIVTNMISGDGRYLSGPFPKQVDSDEDSCIKNWHAIGERQAWIDAADRLEASHD